MLPTTAPFILRVCRSVDALRRLVMLLVLAALAAALRAAPAPVKRSYSIPAGDAGVTLREFIEQSGEQLVYVVTTVRQVKTNAVKGEFTGREVLERMLLNTALTVVEDKKTGALMVRREPTPSGPRNSVPPPSDSQRSSGMSATPMKRSPFSHLAAWLGLVVASIPPATAASAGAVATANAQRGALVGQVSSAATELYLEGAIVALGDTGRTTITDREGRYAFSDVPAGPVSLAVSYTGLTTQKLTVTLSPGQRAVRDVALTSDVYVLDRYVVASIREGQAAAITQQRIAPNVKNVAATDAFGNIADGNAAEALRLLPGVSAINDENESRFVMVRGIDANLNSMTIDGMKLSTGGTGNTRQQDMSQIPLGSVDIMEVTKSPTPDMDGDSVGGNINLRSTSVFDRANPRRITFALSASLRTFGDSAPPTTSTHNRVRPTYAFGFSDVFGAKRNWGVALNLSHTINWTPSAGLLLHTWETSPTYPQYLRAFTHYDYHSVERTRTGANLRVDHKLSEQSRFYVNAAFTGYSSEQMFKGGGASITGLAQVATLDANGRPIPFQPQFPFGDPSYRPGGFNAAGARVQASILPGYTDYYTDVVNATYRVTATLDHAKSERYSLQTGGIHKFGGLEIDYSGLVQTNPAWRGGKDEREDFIRAYTVDVANTSWRLDGTKRNDRARRDVTQTGGPDVYDPLNWTLGGLASTVADQTTDLYGGQINLKRHFQSPVPTYLKAGVKFMSEERQTTNPTVSYTYAGPRDALASLIDTSIKSDLGGGDWHPFGRRAPIYLSVDKITQLRNEHPEYFVSNAATTLQTALQNDKQAREDVLATYIMGQMTLGRLSVLGGVRVETTYVSGESAVQDPVAGNGITDPVQRTQAIWGKRVSVSRDYRNVLPGVHFKYAASRDLLVRASYSMSFGRPSFGSVYPDTRINYDAERITQNNPGLLPQVAENFDLSIEKYFEPVGVISAGVFLKEIKDFLYSSVFRIPGGSDNGFNGEYAGWELATQANGGFGRVRGAEVNYSQQLSFLPGVLKGFGIFANFTYLETEGNYGRVTEPSNGELVNFTPKVASAGLSYSRGRFSGRFNVNHTGDYLRAYNANPLLRSYRKAKNMADLKLSYRYSKELSLFVDVANVFNGKDRFYVGSTPDNYTAVRNFGVRFQSGVQGNF